MDFYNSIWISSVPRTGSMWTSNVVKEIFTKSNFDTYPKQSIQSDIETINFFIKNALNDQNTINRYVFKVHSKIKSDLLRSKMILNLRNPYEICASYYQFMRCKLDEAIKNAEFIVKFLDFYSNKKIQLLKINFEDIENKPVEIIKKISIFCETEISEEKILLIDQKLKKENVEKIIHKNDDKIKKKILNKETINKNEIVIINKDYYRSFDAETGFQTNHISKINNKNWKKIFSNSEIDKIIDILDPIAVKLGYKSEK